MEKVSNQPILCIVIPCYNEEDVLPITSHQFLNQLEKMKNTRLISSNSFILFVNDGSKDRTWDIIQDLSANNPSFSGISLSRNRGHQNALLAGLMSVRDACDACISIDCDGQDDISCMEQMMEAFLGGSDVVYGVRSSRQSDSFFKRVTAQGFYKLLNSMGVEAVYNHADYRLLSKRALDALSEFKEVNLFLRGMVPLIGFNSSIVYYERHERIAGESHYPLSKMLALAIDGITSLSVKPIRLITVFGTLVSLISFFGVLWAVASSLFGNTVPGWASTTAIVCFMGGVQLLSVGVIGEYIGRIYLETKGRPRYIIDKSVHLDQRKIPDNQDRKTEEDRI